MIYKSEFEITEFNRQLSSMIEIHYEDSLMNHLKQQLLLNGNKFAGNINGNKFSLWWYGFGDTGPLYSVIRGEIHSDSEGFTIEIKPKLNILGKWILILMTTFLCYITLDGIIKQIDNSPELFGSITLFWLYAIVAIELGLIFLYYRNKINAIDIIKGHLRLK
jgi:hypothetical protein